MRKMQKGALIKPKNMAAKALGTKQFSAKVVEQKHFYSRKTKFKKGRFDVDQSPFNFAYMDLAQVSCHVGA